MSAVARPRNPALLAAIVLACTAPPLLADEATDAGVGQLDEVTVTGHRVREFRPGALKDELVKTESFSARVLEQVHATNVNESIDKNPGITVQTECSICNVRNVSLNNLPGRFTTLLIDGIPLFSSLSSSYGLDSVNVRGIESVDVARGAGASLIAPEALAGTVNVVTKRPREREFEATADRGGFGATNATLYAARPFDGGALSFGASHHRHDSVDSTDAGISQYSGFDRTLAGIGFFVDALGPFRVKGRLDHVDETRGGGALGDDYDAIRGDASGNPFDWSAGRGGSLRPDGWYAPDGSGFVPYDSGRGGFAEIIHTRRWQALASGEMPAGRAMLRLAAGYAHNVQDSFYEGTTYDAQGDQWYAELSGRVPFGSTLVTAGLNYRFEDLQSRGALPDGSRNDGLDDYRYRVPGAFLQAYRPFLADRLELNASVRLDDHDVFGAITSPRVNALWHHTDGLSSRLSIGRGFRAPTSFFEQDHGILDTVRIVRRVEKPETSDNASYALNWSDDRLSATLSLNYNRIENLALLDAGAVDPVTGEPVTLFTTADTPVTVRGADLTASWQATPRLLVAGGFEFFDYDFAPGTLVFSRPDHAAYLSVAWESDRLQLYARTAYTGPHDLAHFHDYASAPRFNLDGTPKLARSPRFATVDLKADWRLGERMHLYAGADNLFDYRQADVENPLWLDAGGGIDVTHIWGPLRGRYVYAGVEVHW